MHNATRLHTTTFHPAMSSIHRRMPIFRMNTTLEDMLYIAYFLIKPFVSYLPALSFHIPKYEKRKLLKTAHSNEMMGDIIYSPTYPLNICCESSHSNTVSIAVPRMLAPMNLGSLLINTAVRPIFSKGQSLHILLHLRRSYGCILLPMRL